MNNRGVFRIDSKYVIGKRNRKQNKGAWGMPRLIEVTKDVASYEKPWGAASER
jgi:hypothetical protein